MIRHGSRHSGLYVGVTFIVGGRDGGSRVFWHEIFRIVSGWLNWGMACFLGFFGIVVGTNWGISSHGYSGDGRPCI